MNQIYNYIFVSVICVFALIILVHAAWRNSFYTYRMKKQFVFAACATIIVIVAEIANVIFESRVLEGVFPVLIANVVGFSLSPFIAVMLSKAFSVEKGRFGILLAIPAWVNVIVAISSPWTGWIFSVSDYNYSRGPLFGVYIIAYLCSYGILILESLKAMRVYQCYTKSTFIMLLIFTFTGTSLQIILPEIHTAWLCITLSLILYYAYFCELLETQDTLTGLLNRSAYEWYIKSLTPNADGYVVMLDLDDFKQINDEHGHQWGDLCLQIVGKIIKDCFSHLGACYRVGGDEFCVICRTTNEKQLKETLNSFHREVGNARKKCNDPNALPMISTGYAIFRNSGGGYTAAIQEADTQMYHFKNQRKHEL